MPFASHRCGLGLGARACRRVADQRILVDARRQPRLPLPFRQGCRRSGGLLSWGRRCGLRRPMAARIRCRLGQLVGHTDRAFRDTAGEVCPLPGNHTAFRLIGCAIDFEVESVETAVGRPQRDGALGFEMERLLPHLSPGMRCFPAAVFLHRKIVCTPDHGIIRASGMSTSQ